MAHNPGYETGVIVGPLNYRIQPAEYARRVYRLMRCMGTLPEDIGKIWVNMEKGCAKVGLVGYKCENFVVKVGSDFRRLAQDCNLLELTSLPQSFKVIRLRPYAEEYMSLSSFWRNVVEQQNAFPFSYDPLEDDKPTNVIQFPVKPKAPDKTHTVTEITKLLTPMPAEVEEKPIMISAKTSTAVIEPCFFPDRKFYLASETPNWNVKNPVFITEIPTQDDLRPFRNTLGKYVCAFLNTDGGSIYYGVSAAGQIIGFDVSQRLEDKLTLEVDKVMEFMKPDVPVSAYHINFVKIINATGYVEPQLVVLEIKVLGLLPVEDKYAFNGVVYIWAGDSFQILNQAQQSNTAGGSRSSKTGSFNKQGNRGGSSQGKRGGNRDTSRQNSIAGNKGSNRDGKFRGNNSGNSKTDRSVNNGGSRGNKGGSNGNWGGFRQDNRGDHRYGYYDYTSDTINK